MTVEVRAKSVRIHGYVNVVGRDSRALMDASGPYIEQVMPGTFSKALAAGNPVELRFNHNRSLGRSGENLTLKEDNVGLLADAVITDEEVIEKARKQELRGWSFGFVKKKDRWETAQDGSRRRYLEDVELREVSVLDKTPAYIATSIETRDGSDALIEFRMVELDNTVTESGAEAVSDPLFQAKKQLEILQLTGKDVEE